MERTQSIAPPDSRKNSQALSPTTGGLETFWQCVWDAVVLAFLVQIFGSIVIGLVGGLWRQMMPSLPPLFAPHPTLEADDAHTPSSSAGHGPHFFQQHPFAILFGLFLACLLFARFARHLPQARHRSAAAKLSRIFGLVSDQWFGLIVVNAFAAFIGVMILEFVQQFTLAHWLWQICLQILQPVLQPILHLFSGASWAGFCSRMSAWYQSNHSKFLFWLLYSAAICDDLGLPNYKTLSLALWHRISKKPSKPE